MSAPSPSGSPSRRAHRRNAVQVRVRWHNRREESVSARIHDISAEGLFLVPEHALPDSVRAGDPVWVVVTSEGKDETLAGTIRWRGFHPAHHVIGCGIQLDGNSPEIVERLFPIVREG
jgi:hypothetical protein